MGHGFILLFVRLTLHGCIAVRLTPRNIAVRLAPRDNLNAIDVRLTPRGIAVRLAPRGVTVRCLCHSMRGNAVCHTLHPPNVVHASSLFPPTFLLCFTIALLQCYKASYYSKQGVSCTVGNGTGS